VILLQASHSLPTSQSILVLWQRKVKTDTSSSPKYVTSDEETLSSDDDNASSDDNEPLPSEFCKNPNVMIKGLMKQLRVRDELLEQQEELLVEETKKE
jgi:hypothetical protein